MEQHPIKRETEEAPIGTKEEVTEKIKDFEKKVLGGKLTRSEILSAFAESFHELSGLIPHKPVEQPKPLNEDDTNNYNLKH